MMLRSIFALLKLCAASMFFFASILESTGCKTYVQCNGCNGSGEITCLNCKGDKQYDIVSDCYNCQSGEVSCSVCDGDGARSCKNCESSGMTLQPCVVCGGSGFDFARGGMVCRACGGAVMTMQLCLNCYGQGSEECERCNGDGKTDCRTCQGNGSVRETGICNECDPNGKKQCLKCQGKGEVES